MVKKRSGKIVNISSISAEVADVGAVPYCAAKGGVKMLTKGIALELAPYNINVNAVAPGFIRTEIADGWFNEPLNDTAKWYLSRIPWRRFGQPEEVTGVVVFLCSEDARYLTGVTIFCDGGFMTV
jgi:NAD(P)-dependent dehydrogenase (short-subunit alcohol dehydrogenase family)